MPTTVGNRIEATEQRIIDRALMIGARTPARMAARDNLRLLSPNTFIRTCVSIDALKVKSVSCNHVQTDEHGCRTTLPLIRSYKDNDVGDSPAGL